MFSFFSFTFGVTPPIPSQAGAVGPELVAACQAAAVQQGLLPGENNAFITKCLQYKELLDVRHSPRGGPSTPSPHAVLADLDPSQIDAPGLTIRLLVGTQGEVEGSASTWGGRYLGEGASVFFLEVLLRKNSEGSVDDYKGR